SAHQYRSDIGHRPANLDKSIKNWFGVVLRVIDSKLYLVHQTAREFLIKGPSSGQGNWQYTIYSKDSNFLLADICISYLSLEDFEMDPLVIDRHRSHREQYRGYLVKYSLLDYAATHWAHHFRDSLTRQMELVQSTRLICEGGSKRFLTWFRVYWKNTSPNYVFPDDCTDLMVAR